MYFFELETWIQFIIFQLWEVWYIFIYFIQHCFICRPLDSTLLEAAGIEPRIESSFSIYSQSCQLLGCISSLDSIYQLCLSFFMWIFLCGQSWIYLSLFYFIDWKNMFKNFNSLTNTYKFFDFPKQPVSITLAVVYWNLWKSTKPNKCFILLSPSPLTQMLSLYYECTLHYPPTQQ